MATTTRPDRQKSINQTFYKEIRGVGSQISARTLVTGGTGFLGSHLVRELVEDGVKNLCVLTTSPPAWLAELGVEVIEGSITDPNAVSKAVSGVTEIYHLAGKYRVTTKDATRCKLHVEGTRNLCIAARSAGVKSIVMASTSGTIAVTSDGEMLPDEEWPQPVEIISRWPYYSSKYFRSAPPLKTSELMVNGLLSSTRAYCSDPETTG